MSLVRRFLGDRPVEEDILCLAFSRKYQGRCFAGLSLRDGRWVRPVSSDDYGTLSARHYRLAGGGDPEVLDVIRVPLDRPQPDQHQPENHLMAGGPWRLLSRPAGPQATRLITAAIERRPLIFGFPGDRIAYREMLDHPIPESLTLVAPRDVKFMSTRSYRGNPQARVMFSHQGAWYSLAVTDPDWELQIASRTEGRYRPSEFGLDDSRLLLTISLGEPFEGACYKLVAAIFELPAGLRDSALVSAKIAGP